jgi:hypothetical protein
METGNNQGTFICGVTNGNIKISQIKLDDFDANIIERLFRGNIITAGNDVVTAVNSAIVLANAIGAVFDTVKTAPNSAKRPAITAKDLINTARNAVPADDFENALNILYLTFDTNGTNNDIIE